jgi:hypothetical protein
MSRMKRPPCDYKDCHRRAKWNVEAIFGMSPRCVLLHLCHKHRNSPMTILGMEKIKTKKKENKQ